MEHLTRTNLLAVATALFLAGGAVAVGAAEPAQDGAAAEAVAAQEKAEEVEAAEEADPLAELLGDSEKCLHLNRIDSTRVVDDRSIIFYTLGDGVYLNRLPHRCPGLRRNDTFMYETSLNRLCDVDIITVLDDIGFGFSRGPSCGLGKFYTISDETAKALLSRD